MNFKGIIILAFCFCLTHRAVYASLSEGKEQEIIHSFTQQALKQYEQGDVHSAVMNYSRALLLDRNNQDVIQSLIQIAPNAELNPNERLQLIHFQNLYESIQNLEQKIALYEARQKDFLGQLSEDNLLETTISEGLNKIKQESLGRQENIPDVPNEQAKIAEEDPLKYLNHHFALDLRDLSQKIVYLDKQYHYLRELVQKNPQMALSHSVQFPMDSNPSQTTQSTQDISYEPIGSPEMVLSQEDNRILKEEFKQVYSQLKEMENLIKSKDQKIGDLSSQLINASLKISETESEVTKKDEAINNITNDLNDLQSRFDLGQKIIQDKDSQIQSLKNEDVLTQSLENQKSLEKLLSDAQAQFIQAEALLKDRNKKIIDLEMTLQGKSTTEKEKKLESILASKDNQLNELHDTLRMYRLSMNQALQKDEAVGVLETKFQNQQELLSIQEKKMGALKSALEREQAKKEGRVDSLKKVIGHKDSEISEMKGIVDVYSGRIGDLKSELNAKNTDILSLQNEVSSMQSKLYEKDNVLKKTQSDIQLLEDQLTTIQNKLWNIKDINSDISSQPDTSSSASTLK